MKRFLMVLLIGTLFSGSRANVVPPQAYITEILVDSSGNWSIEMEFYYDPYIYVDSVFLVTSTGSSRINNYNAVEVDDFVYLGVITIADLESPVTINPDGDFVQLISYSWDETNFSDVSFGNYPGSYLDCIQNGESVASVIGFYGMDKSPSIGSINDTAGAMGNFSGIAYDLSGNPFIGGLIFTEIDGLTIVLNTDGFFSERIVNRRYNFDTISHYTAPPANYDFYTIDAINFCLRPDSSYYQDIITTSLIIGIDDKEVIDENIVTIAPNPFSDKVVFYFNLKNTDPSDEMGLSIYSLDGRELQHINLSSDQLRYDWTPSGEVSPGTLIYRLEKNSQLIKSGKFIKR